MESSSFSYMIVMLVVFVKIETQIELSLPFIFPISILFQINETVRSAIITLSLNDS